LTHRVSVACEEIELPGAGGDALRGFLAVPEGASGDERGRPAVVLVHEVFGVDRHLEEIARRLAREGFVVLAPDLFSREGLPGPASTQEDPAPAWPVETIRSAVLELPDRRALADLDAAASLLAARDDVDGERVAVVGFCMGGTLAFLAGCTSTAFAGVVAFYGRPLYPDLSAAKPMQPVEMALNLDRPLLAFFGDADEQVPLEHVSLLRQALEAGMKDFELVTYPGAGHGFFNHARPSYHEPSARDAWERTLGFLRAID
jgi:carboxymethylenebutenolidase